MNRVLTLFLFVTFTLSSFAQSNFNKFSIGAGAGLTQSFTEVQKHDFGLAGYGTLDYLFTPFISLGLEVQKGEINGGDFRSDPRERQFVNSYLAFSLNGKVSLGALVDDRYNGTADLLKGLYFGAGLGAISNSTLYTTGRSPVNPDRTLTAEIASKDIYFPLNLGINVYFANAEGFYRYALNLNYQGNITLGEGLDGYDDSREEFKSGKPDIYTFFSVGLKYNFGTLGLSRKNFRKY